MNCPGHALPSAGLTAVLLFTMLIAQAQTDISSSRWKPLPVLPDPTGLAAPFAGVSGDALIVAGGANFPDAMPWEGGKKAWHDAIYVLTQPEGQWQSGFKLPRPLAYGVAVTTPDGVLCAGGSDANGHFRDVFQLQWAKGTVVTKNFPVLPRPLANGCGALVGNVFYLAGGTDKPDATNALPTFWALDLTAPNLAWRELEPWPGPARMLAVAGSWAGGFFLFSGVELTGDANGKPVRHYLKDAYRFTPDRGWKRLADLPRAAVAAPSPAISSGNELLIVSGDDGARVNFEPKSAHPGFPRDMIGYNPQTDQWRSCGESPLSRATVPVVFWRGAAVIPSGEARPGWRTPEVWAWERQ